MVEIMNIEIIKQFNYPNSDMKYFYHGIRNCNCTWGLSQDKWLYFKTEYSNEWISYYSANIVINLKEMKKIIEEFGNLID